jgi:hypothetical protein
MIDSVNYVEIQNQAHSTAKLIMRLDSTIRPIYMNALIEYLKDYLCTHCWLSKAECTCGVRIPPNLESWFTETLHRRQNPHKIVPEKPQAPPNRDEMNFLTRLFQKKLK